MHGQASRDGQPDLLARLAAFERPMWSLACDLACSDTRCFGPGRVSRDGMVCTCTAFAAFAAFAIAAPSSSCELELQTRWYWCSISDVYGRNCSCLFRCIMLLVVAYSLRLDIRPLDHISGLGSAAEFFYRRLSSEPFRLQIQCQ